MPEPSSQIMMLMMERGEIVLAEISVAPDFPSHIVMSQPALVLHDRATHGALAFMLSPWLPNELLKLSIFMVHADRVVGVMMPTPELLSFYKAWAGSEKEKLKLFSAEFNAQVTEIEKQHMRKFTLAKERRKKEVYVSAQTLPETLVKIFEEENDWGDPTVTH